MNEAHKKNGVRRAQKSKPASPLKNTGQTRNTHKKNIYKKSRYYRDRRKKIIAALGIAGAVLLLLVIIFGARACSQTKSSSAASDGQNTQAGTENGRESAVSKKGKAKDDGSEPQDETGGGQSGETSSLPAEPVSLTVSVVGDCTLGTDENFDYDTSLNAYYESYGADYFFSNVKSIFSADDLTIANFEGTLTYSEEREDKQFAFKAPPE
ncbi:MAG TPA: CapA family protein, partial [Candidatus Blautia excrementigallinarum]|nr:CapA family protein [Candidatus Blautia excrementigallinarum]